MTIVLDSNVLVSIIGTKNRLRPIWEAFLDGRFSIVVSEDILKEYEEILQQRAAPGVVSYIMGVLAESPEVVNASLLAFRSAKKPPIDTLREQIS